MISIEQAIMSLRPNALWSMNGDDVEDILWHTEGVEPLTVAAVGSEIQRLEAAAEQAAADKAAAAASGRAKLAALGLTDDEINALLGGR